VFVFALLFLWQSSFEVTRIDIEGLSRFTPAAVLTAVELKTGASAGKPEFDAACQRLIGTGLFEGCNWKYAPVSRTAVVLTLQLKEAQAAQKVRLTVPGVDDKTLWEWLRVNEPLVQPEMPASDEAIQFYTRAVQRYLKRDVVATVHSNLETRENILVFRPKDVPSITSVKFTGTQAIDAAALEKTFTPVATGTPFTEYDVRQLLDLNVRPMYENLGRLNVTYPSVRMDGGTVVVEVNEGRTYTLAAVTFNGIPSNVQPKLPIGEVARWNQIVTALEGGSKALRDQGYLQAKYDVKRTLNDEAGSVDLSVTYAPGEQFVFRSLRLGGVSPAMEQTLRSLWTLAAGAPIRESYVDDFIRRAFEKLGPEYSGVGHQFEPAGKNVVDVSITFRRR
jgi:outer membrane protein insertion porin family